MPCIPRISQPDPKILCLLHWFSYYVCKGSLSDQLSRFTGGNRDPGSGFVGTNLYRRHGSFWYGEHEIYGKPLVPRATQWAVSLFVLTQSISSIDEEIPNLHFVKWHCHKITVLPFYIYLGCLIISNRHSNELLSCIKYRLSRFILVYHSLDQVSRNDFDISRNALLFVKFFIPRRVILVNFTIPLNALFGNGVIIIRNYLRTIWICHLNRLLKSRSDSSVSWSITHLHFFVHFKVILLSVYYFEIYEQICSFQIL